MPLSPEVPAEATIHSSNHVDVELPLHELAQDKPSTRTDSEKRVRVGPPYFSQDKLSAGLDAVGAEVALISKSG
jgi:hypothetical protein